MNSLDAPRRARVMGIVNVTPDSFSDGGRYATVDAAIAHAEQMAREGADIIDVGGESTRPGAHGVSASVEISRVAPVIRALAGALTTPISIDSSKPEVMRAAVEAGASIINDVRALREPGALETAAELEVTVCLMHMQGEPRTMQEAPQYVDVVSEVEAFLRDRLDVCEAAGIDRRRIIVDPGFGFGKTAEHNLQLLASLDRFTALGAPLMVGLSRKATIGALTGRPIDERAVGSAVAAVMAVERGAAIVRVHDVAATRDALAVYDAVRAFSDVRELG